MAEMDRIKSAAEQSYLSFLHKQLTTNLCVIERKYYQRDCKTSMSKSRRHRTMQIQCHSTFHQKSV
jgi:hypothetical protein